ncbi:MAG: adenosylcobinamide-GDP ribazoletransferase [Alphaproteobacteria bacterium HGW-Alphaproteobacteria-1]|nr:MAG: adenosylcobinamide-GDP ribazoletransferase [Alphaproteobacteria bacterium HGW-Alphaproteobacteria-1]
MTDKALFRPIDLALAFGLLTRLPVSVSDATRGARAAWAWPLAGAVLGSLAALVCWGALALGLPAPVGGLLALGTLVMLSGALHEDGLADTADGLWGGWTRERRLEIMRDSRVGSYGVIALILTLALRGVAIWFLVEAAPGAAAAALVTSAMLSRAAMAGAMAALPHARESGLAQAQGRPPVATVAVAVALALGAALLLCGISGLVAAAMAALMAGIIARLALARIGGQTGDVLGAVQQGAEIAALLTLLA